MEISVSVGNKQITHRTSMQMTALIIHVFGIRIIMIQLYKMIIICYHFLPRPLPNTFFTSMCAIIFQYKICGVQTGKVMTEQNVVVFLINNFDKLKFSPH